MKKGVTLYCNSLIFQLSDKRDSNSRPSAWEANALPTELLSHFLTATIGNSSANIENIFQ